MTRKLLPLLLAVSLLLTGCTVSLYSEGTGRDVVLSLPNEDGTGFDMVPTTVSRNGVLSQAVIDTLAEAGAVPKGIQVKHLAQTGDALDVELNDALSAALKGAGSTEEFMYIGSLVNSLLSAYGAKTIVLNVGGAPLETGHNVYDGPLTFFVCEE